MVFVVSTKTIKEHIFCLNPILDSHCGIKHKLLETEKRFCICQNSIRDQYSISTRIKNLIGIVVKLH